MANRRIGLFLQSRDNDYQQLLRDDCLAAASQRGFTVTVSFADGDADRQVHQVREALGAPPAQRVLAVMVSPVRESTLMPIVHDALRTGVAWVALSRWSDYLGGQRTQFPGTPVLCVLPDHEQIGRIQALQFRALLPHGGELIYIRGPLGTFSAERRLAGMQKGLAGSSLRPVIFNSDWSSEGAKRAMGDWIRVFGGRELPPCVVGAQNDSMAMGAREALIKAVGANNRDALKRFAITGCDGSPSYGKRLVSAGELAATVVVPPVSGRALTELASVLDGGPVPPLAITLEVHSYPDVNLLVSRS
jgi:ABC-type sugar transport system substrate-binding protein